MGVAHAVLLAVLSMAFLGCVAGARLQADAGSTLGPRAGIDDTVPHLSSVYVELKNGRCASLDAAGWALELDAFKSDPRVDRQYELLRMRPLTREYLTTHASTREHVRALLPVVERMRV